MRFRADNIAADRNFIMPAPAGPFLSRVGQLPANPAPSLAVGDNQTANLCELAHGQDFTFSTLEPSNDPTGNFGHEDCMRLQVEHANKPCCHLFTAHRITEGAIQFRHAHSIADGRSPYIYAAHRDPGNFELLFSCGFVLVAATSRNEQPAARCHQPESAEAAPPADRV